MERFADNESLIMFFNIIHKVVNMFINNGMMTVNDSMVIQYFLYFFFCICFCIRVFIYSSSTSFANRKTFFVNGTTTPRRQGEYVRMPPELCNTYKLIAENGGDDFYNGTLADLIIDDLRDLGSIITKKDLESYR